MLSDFPFIFQWWLSLFVISLLSLPLTFLFFQKFWDKGYIFAKSLSLFLLSYLTFLLGLVHLFPFTFTTQIILCLFWGVFNYSFLIKKLPDFKNILKKSWKIFLFEEFLFFLVLLSWAFVRAFAPDIEGLEKFMDWGFVNSILRSRFFPPSDMWYAGESINYYYFGHLVFAFLTKLSGVISAVGYNLSIATIAALTFVSSFSFTSNLIYPLLKKLRRLRFFLLIFIPLLSAILLTFGGNLHPLYKISKISLEKRISLPAAAKTYWYPDATRFIGYDPDIPDKTIHEFPAYSFIVADLHGHLNDLPWVIFIVAFLFASLGLVKKPSFWLFLPSGLFLSLAYMTNAWDFAVYGLLFAVTLFIFTKNFSVTVVLGLLTLLSWFVFSLPFNLHFSSMAEGIVLADTHTPLYQLFILYGGFWLLVLPFLIFVYKQRHRPILNSSDLMVFALISTATLLVFIPEFIYLKDIYMEDYRRANTMFKLVYQAFVMYGLTLGYLYVRFRRFFTYRLLFALILLFHLSYLYFGLNSYYGLKNYQGLWGLNFLKNSYPDNLKAINWLNQNISGQPHLLEAPGDSYTTFCQVSAATGLPTIEGWTVHEWLWRGGYDAPAARIAEVDTVYQSQDYKQIKSILDKYQIKYIFVGSKEYERYPGLNINHFSPLNGQIVFNSGTTYIYALP